MNPASAPLVRTLALAGVLTAIMAAAPARAAPLPRRDVYRFGPDLGAAEALLVGTGILPPPGSLRMVVAAELEASPFVLLPGDEIRGRGLLSGGEPLRTSDRHMVHLGLATTLTRRFELSLRIPFVVATPGGDPNLWGSAPRASGFDLPLSARGRFQLTSQVEGDPVSAAVSLEVLPLALGLFPPTRVAYDATEERGVGARLEVGRRFGPWLAAWQLGALFRRSIDYGTARLGPELNLGAVVATTGAPLRGELAALSTVGFGGAGVGAELLGAVRYALSSFELFALAGPGFGSAPGIPTYRCLAGLGWRSTPKEKE